MEGRLDRGCVEAMRQVIRPELHGLIGPWMQRAPSDTEMRGFIELARISDNPLRKAMGRPRRAGWAPSNTAEVMLGMRRNMSDPGLFVEPEPELQNISKPGGAVLKWGDSIFVQRMKNKERSKGTLQSLG
eukprot:gnl/TRDRNA2_/TRDRNA2_185431_c0_seq1.p2 gnl/TRDRNA2_/TRDRNA2_185431_c0~~gnl/TRDRNA2_/TRDRNA2_185431_c0_seq1.p2  ORF type:complete len:130 (-),score=26.64 gnl/TRDRNA2_/TRDRNA2_185431_c0_seq1:162-551(-)